MRGRKNQSFNAGAKGKAKPIKYKQPSIVSGKSVTDILNMDIRDFNKLGLSDLRKVVGRLVSAVNKRIRRFMNAGVSTPATRALEKSGGMLSTKGKDLNQLRTEYARGRDFLNMETSSHKGFEEVQKKTVETLKDRGVDVTTDELDDIFEVYGRLKEIDPSVGVILSSSQVIGEIAKLDNTQDVQTRIMQAKERYNELYEENQEQYGRDVTLYGVSGFFEI